MDAISLTSELKGAAQTLGFQLTGACPAVTPQGIAPSARWLEAGYAGKMAYLADRQTAYEHPHHVLAGARSLLMLGMSYINSAPGKAREGQGGVARFAMSPVDYHDFLHDRLRQLCQLASKLQPGVRVRGVVDTAPLLEREFAQLAGLGWIGKNTMLLNRRHGSWFFLAALLLDCELSYDAAMQSNHCGTCTACLDACPTQAFPEPFVLDATRCISYLTIELRSPIPRDLRPGIGNWLFGCDVCQDVCPWNHRATKSLASTPPSPAPLPFPFLDPPLQQVDLHALFQLSDETFRHRFRRTVFWRSRRRGMLRNAAIILGNQAAPNSHDALSQALQDSEPLVRGAAAWALGRIGASQSPQTLRDRLDVEQDPDIRDEIQCALARYGAAQK